MARADAPSRSFPFPRALCERSGLPWRRPATDPSPATAKRPHPAAHPAHWAACLLLALPGLPACATPPGSGHPPGGLRGTAGSRAPGYLGIRFQDVPDERSRELHLASNRGVEVVMVDHDGPAGKAGLRVNDIIVSLNGQALAGTEALRRLIHDAGSGVQIVLTVLRGGHPLTLTAQLATQDEVTRSAMAHLAAQENTPAAADVEPPPAALGSEDRLGPEGASGTTNLVPAAPATPPPGSGFLGHIVHGSIYTGAVLDTMEPQLAGFFGAPQGMGLLVHSVLQGSPAAFAGLRAGDVIIRADLYNMHNTSDWAKRLHAAKGRPILLSVLRDRRELTLTLQQDPKHHTMLEWPSL